MFFTVSEYEEMFRENAKPLSDAKETSGRESNEKMSARVEMDLFWEMFKIVHRPRSPAWIVLLSEMFTGG